VLVELGWLEVLEVLVGLVGLVGWRRWRWKVLVTKRLEGGRLWCSRQQITPHHPPLQIAGYSRDP